MMKTVEITPPYLVFTGEAVNTTYAKTGFGIVEWRRDLCLGQLKLNKEGVDLGLLHMTPKEAAAAGVKSLIIGTAAVGGAVPVSWLDTLVEAMSEGLDIIGGVHERLNDIPLLKKAASKYGVKLVDVRVPPASLPVGTGKKRIGKRILTVGTDCAVGKKYTALALERDMKKAGMNADFRASGQTGIMIAGKGIPIDSVVSDFVAGAAELLSPDNTPDHWDIIEGQGGILHPGYSAVSMGLLVGSQPDAFVVCIEAGRTHIEGWGTFELPTIEEVIEVTTTIGKQMNPNIRCVGVSVNTSALSEEKRTTYLSDISQRIGVPCVDPIKDGTHAIVDHVQKEFSF